MNTNLAMLALLIAPVALTWLGLLRAYRTKKVGGYFLALVVQVIWLLLPSVPTQLSGLLGGPTTSLGQAADDFQQGFASWYGMPLFLICLTFLAAPLVTFGGGQIRMEEFQAAIPPKPRWGLQLLIEVAGIAMFALFAVAAVVTISKNMQNQTATLEMPFWLFMAPLALGATLLAVETAVMLHHTWQRKRPEDKQTMLS